MMNELPGRDPVSLFRLRSHELDAAAGISKAVELSTGLPGQFAYLVQFDHKA